MKIAALVAALAVVAWPPAAALAAPAPISATVQAGEIRMHYLQAGAGATMVVLLHGWPESSYEWRKVVPLLAQRYTVVAPDLRGIGESGAPATGYDKATLAADVHALVATLKPRRLVVVGHDIGGQVAYAYARLYPDEVAGVAILDVPIPGGSTWATIEPLAWHFGLNEQAPLAAQLVAGRQAVYFRYFIDRMSADPKAVTDEDVATYARAYGPPERLDAGFAFYRAFAQDKAWNAAHTGPLRTPVLLAGGEKSLWPLIPKLSADLKGWGAADVRTAMIPRSGHFIADEQPEATAKVISDFVDGLR